jgi:hypothetical protein
MKTVLKFSLFAVLMLVGLLSDVSSAKAQCGGSPYFSQWNYRAYSMDSVPYFALHPPVYYSYPVPRTYGYSPFAYPFGSPTPEIAPVTANQEIINPYVPQEPKPKKSQPVGQRTAAVVPQVIFNPFVAPEERQPTVTGE